MNGLRPRYRVGAGFDAHALYAIADKGHVYRRLIGQDVIDRAHVDISVKPDAIETLPDFFIVKTPIFSDRARQVLEEFDADLGWFYTARLTSAETGRPIEKRYWSFFPKRMVACLIRRPVDMLPYTASDGPVRQHLRALFWVDGALDLLAHRYPVLDDIGSNLPMNRDLFVALKSRDLTGLTEIPANARERLAELGKIYDRATENVNHVPHPTLSTAH